MAALAPALPFISAGATIGGTILSAAGARAAGQAANTEAQFQAAQYKQQAGQERAEAQRASLEERRKTRIAESRALALSAASGAGASDPTVLDIMGDLSQEGEYRALTALFNGEERARTYETGAAAKRFEGASAKAAGNIAAGSALFKGVSTLGSGGTSLLEKYG